MENEYSDVPKINLVNGLKVGLSQSDYYIGSQATIKDNFIFIVGIDMSDIREFLHGEDKNEPGLHIVSLYNDGIFYTIADELNTLPLALPMVHILYQEYLHGGFEHLLDVVQLMASLGVRTLDQKEPDHIFSTKRRITAIYTFGEKLIS